MNEKGENYEKNKRKTKRKQEARKKRLANFNSTGWKKENEYLFTKNVNGILFKYWPSTMKAMYRDEVIKDVSEPDELIESIKK